MIGELFQTYGDLFLWVLGGLLLLLALLGLPLFAVIAAATFLCYAASPIKFTSIFIQVSQIVTQPLYMTIPLFTLAGTIMAEGKTPTRLVNLFRAFFGWMPGGLAVVAVTACAFFTAFTGASGVTIIALGGLLYPILSKERYPDGFRLGLLTTGGSLGLLFPPSLPLIIYALVAGSMARGVDVDTLFRAGVLPGFLLLFVLAGYSFIVGVKNKVPRQAFGVGKALGAVKGAAWEIPIPIIIIGGIYGGYITPTEAAAATAFYVLVIEIIIHRDLGLRRLPGVIRDSMELVGAIILIIAMALGLVNYLVDAQIAHKILVAMRGAIMDEQEMRAAGDAIRDEAATIETVPALTERAGNLGGFKSAAEDSYNAVAWYAAAQETRGELDAIAPKADAVAAALGVLDPIGDGAFITCGGVSSTTDVPGRTEAIRAAILVIEGADLESEQGQRDVREDAHFRDGASLVRELRAFLAGLPAAPPSDLGPLAAASRHAFDLAVLLAEASWAEHPGSAIHEVIASGRGGDELRTKVEALSKYLAGLEALDRNDLGGLVQEMEAARAAADATGLGGSAEGFGNAGVFTRALDAASQALQGPPIDEATRGHIAGTRARLADLEAILARARIWFLLLVNLFLLVVGCLMDIYSALLVVVPILLPMALWYGVDPVHFGIIFLTNLEIGYMTPPVGINLFLSSLRFKRPVMQITWCCMPFLLLLGACLLVITYFEPLTMYLVRMR